jgi:hypothetical protein
MATLKKEEVEKSLIELYQSYNADLDSYTDDQFNFKQSDDIWSLAEMYDHLCKSSSHFFMANLLRCLEERKGQDGGEMNENGHKIIRYNSFPPLKFKQPSSTIVKKIEVGPKLSYSNYLKELVMNVASIVSKMPTEPSNYRCYHPVFDWLNSHEWLQMLEIHTRHHVRQQKELEGYAGL